MYTTLNFNEMNLVQKLDWVSDMLGEACCMVNGFKPYKELSEQEQKQVKIQFFDFLNKENAVLTSSLIALAEEEYKTSPLASLLRQYGYHVITPDTPIKKAAEALQAHKENKITIVKFSDFGFPIAIQTVLNSVEVKPYAQYSESLVLIHKPKRKRSLWKNTILPNESVIILEGWHNVDSEKLTYNTLEENENITVKQSKYGSFDNNFLKDVLNYIKADPIVNITK